MLILQPGCLLLRGKKSGKDHKKISLDLRCSTLFVGSDKNNVTNWFFSNVNLALK